MKKIIYGLLISLALVVFTFSSVLAYDVNRPATDTPQPPPATETPVPPPTETRLPPPTDTSEPTPTSPPEETATPFEPVGESTPTIEVDPTPTETIVPGVTVTPGKNHKPTPTWDCIKFPDNQDKCLAHTGIGDNPLIPTAFLGFFFFAVAFVLWMRRHAMTEDK